MDTILIPTESLKHLGDSVHIVLSNSIPTFQNAAKEAGFWTVTIKDIIQILVSSFGIIISVIALWNTYVNNKHIKIQEARKEENRISNLNKHLITWLSIIKLEVMRQAELVNDSNLFNSEFYDNSNFRPADRITFSFDKILELDKVSLTEAFIINTSDPLSNNHKLSLLVSMKDELEKILSKYDQFFKEINKEYHSKMKTVQTHLQLIDDANDVCNESKINFKRIQKLLFAGIRLKNLETLDEGLLKYGAFNFDFELQKGDNINLLCDAVNAVNKFTLYVGSTNSTLSFMEINLLMCARNIQLLEKYYSDAIDNDEFKTAFDINRDYITEEIVRELYYLIDIELISYDIEGIIIEKER